MAKKKSKAKKFNAALAVILAIVCLFVGLVGGYFGYLFVIPQVVSAFIFWSLATSTRAIAPT